MNIKIYSVTLLASAMLSLPACAASGNGNGSSNDLYVKLGYYLPKNVLEVTGTITKETTFVPYRIETPADGNGVATSYDWDVYQCPEKTSSKDLSVRQILLADTNHYYPFEMTGGFFSDVETNLTISETGLLTSVNAKSTGKAGSAVKAIGSFIGQILPFLGGGALESTDSKHNFDLSEINANAHKPAVLCTNPELRSLAVNAWYEEEPPAALAGVTAAIDSLNTKLNDLRAEKLGFFETYATGTTEDTMIAAEKKYAVLNKLLSELENQKKVYETASKGIKDKFIKDKKLTPIERIVKVHKRFDVTEIPDYKRNILTPFLKKAYHVRQHTNTPNYQTCVAKHFKIDGDDGIGSEPKLHSGEIIDEALHKCTPTYYTEIGNTNSIYPQNMTFSDVIDALQPFPSMLELFKETESLIALKRQPQSRPLLSDEELKEKILSSKKGITLYARSAQSAEVFLLQLNSIKKDHKGTDNKYLTAVSVDTLDLVASDALVIPIPLKKSAWAERKLNLVFHDNGALKSVGSYNQAAADQIFTGLGDGISGALDGYKSTLTSITDIKKAELGLQTFDEQAQLDALKREKELIDTKISLEGANISAELANEKAVVDAQLAFLSSQSGLAAKELELLQNQQKLSQFGQPPGEAAQLAADLQILQLKSQIAALTATPAAPSYLQKLQERLAVLETRLGIVLTQQALDDARDN